MVRNPTFETCVVWKLSRRCTTLEKRGVCACVCVHVYVCICVFMYMYVCMCVCVCVSARQAGVRFYMNEPVQTVNQVRRASVGE